MAKKDLYEFEPFGWDVINYGGGREKALRFQMEDRYIILFPEMRLVPDKRFRFDGGINWNWFPPLIKKITPHNHKVSTFDRTGAPWLFKADYLVPKEKFLKNCHDEILSWAGSISEVESLHRATRLVTGEGEKIRRHAVAIHVCALIRSGDLDTLEAYLAEVEEKGFVETLNSRGESEYLLDMFSKAIKIVQTSGTLSE